MCNYKEKFKVNNIRSNEFKIFNYASIVNRYNATLLNIKSQNLSFKRVKLLNYAVSFYNLQLKHSFD